MDDVETNSVGEFQYFGAQQIQLAGNQVGGIFGFDVANIANGGQQQGNVVRGTNESFGHWSQYYFL